MKTKANSKTSKKEENDKRESKQKEGLSASIRDEEEGGEKNVDLEEKSLSSIQGLKGKDSKTMSTDDGGEPLCELLCDPLYDPLCDPLYDTLCDTLLG